MKFYIQPKNREDVERSKKFFYAGMITIFLILTFILIRTAVVEENYKVFILPFFVLLYCVFRLLIVRKDYDKRVTVVEHESPDGVGPLVAEVVLSGKLSFRSLEAELLYLVEKRIISVEEVTPSEKVREFVNKDFEYKILKDVDPIADPISFEVLKFFFAGNTSLGTKTYESYFWYFLYKIGEKGHPEHRKSYIQLEEKILRLMAPKYFRENPKINRDYLNVGLIAAIGGAFAMDQLGDMDKDIPWWILSITLSGAVLSAFAGIFNFAKRTTYGARLERALRGFERYIKKVDLPRIENANVSFFDLTSYKTHLSYAVAFGDTVKPFSLGSIFDTQKLWRDMMNKPKDYILPEIYNPNLNNLLENAKSEKYNIPKKVLLKMLFIVGIILVLGFLKSLGIM